MKADLLRHQKPVKRQRSISAHKRRRKTASVRAASSRAASAGGFNFEKTILTPVKQGLASFWGLFRRHVLTARTLGIFFGVLFAAGASFLVVYAVSSPEAPPTSLVSLLNSPMNNTGLWEREAPIIVLPSEEGGVISFSSFEEEDLTGTGVQDRSQDIFYTVQPRDSLSEIAYSYNLRYDVLAFYNKIPDPNRVKAGTIIKIPSIDNAITAQEELAKLPPPPPRKVQPTTKTVKIGYESSSRGENSSGIFVQFSVLDPAPDKLQSFEWDFGDGKRGSLASPAYEYVTPKTYVVRLTAQDSSGVLYKSNPLYIDVPHPSSTRENSATKFITLSSMDELFVTNGIVLKAAGYQDLEEGPFDFAETDHVLTKVRFEKPGYYGLTVLEPNGLEQYYSIFVSPLPSMHAESFMENLNWYRTQYNTGTSSNCGPAAVSMAVSWSLGKYYPVSSVREAVGWRGDGGTSFDELLKVIRDQGITGASIESLRTVQDIRDVVDDGSIAIILFHTSGLEPIRSSSYNDLFGRYYNDSVGHYIVIKGYSLNGEYFVAHDPIPSDWNVNSFRYGDEVSMVGRNRYYSAANVLRSLRRYEMIVVPRLFQP